MQTEIANKQKVLVTRDGIEIWLDEEKWKKIEYAIDNQIGQFYEIDGRRLSKADIRIFLPEDIENRNRRRNGQWICKYSKWHERNEKCECHKNKIQIENDRRLKEMKEAGNISEEERINNSKKFRGMRKNIFKDDNEKN